jgi:murein L,D-transpeptidase YafK
MRLALVLMVVGCAASPVATEQKAAVVAADEARPPELRARAWLEELCATAGVEYPPADTRVVIHKAERRIELYSGDTLLGAWPVALGHTPEGDKEVEGDGKTPEGEFRVVTRNDKSSFRLFLGLSYPAVDDAARGLRDGLIDESTAARIRRAHARGDAPPWSTPLGGAVGIHGHGSRGDWTLGCIAVEDEVIDLLWEALPAGARVTVLP